MKKELKQQVIETIEANLAKCPNFYLVDIAGLNAEDTASLRRDCFGEGALPLYAGKAAAFRAMYRIVNEEGMGIDVCPPGEIATAVAAGVDMSRETPQSCTARLPPSPPSSSRSM